MYGIFVFLSYVASLSVVGAGFLYCFDKEKFDEISNKLSWNTVKYYHKANIEMRKFLEKDTENKKIKSKKSKTLTNKNCEVYIFTGYNVKEDSTFNCTFNKLEEKMYYIDEAEFDIMFIKKITKTNEKLWKRVLDKDELNDLESLKMFKPVEKPFLQIEYCISENDTNNIQKIEIHNKLQPFYIENNLILDKTFIEWFINSYFNEIHNEEYNLQIIDSQISIFKMTNLESCLLNDTGYEIKQN